MPLLFVLDLIGDKIPALDSVLHLIGLVIAPASGALLFAAQTDATSDLAALHGRSGCPADRQIVDSDDDRCIRRRT